MRSCTGTKFVNGVSAPKIYIYECLFIEVEVNAYLFSYSRVQFDPVVNYFRKAFFIISLWRP